MKKLVTIVVFLMSIQAVARDLNRQNYLVGERASGMGGAFVSLVGDPASSYYNPAGLASLYKRGISLSASVYQLLLENYDKILDLDTGDGSTISADMTSNTFGTFPSSMVYLLPLDDNKEPDSFHHVLAFSVLVPDFDKFVAKIDKPIGEYAFELKGKFFNEDMTYWAGPSYALSIGGKLRLGLSLFVLAHMTETRASLGLKQGFSDEFGDYNAYSTSSLERSGLSVTMLAQLGIQYDFTSEWSAGLTLRSPTMGTFYSSVSMLSFNSGYFENLDGTPLEGAYGYVDRIETEEVEMNYRLPLMIAAGLSYDNHKSFAWGLDASFHLAQSAYNIFSGKFVYPKDPDGNDIIDESRGLDPNEQRQNYLVFNVNTGCEFKVRDDIMGRIGLFTNFSSVDQKYYGQSIEGRSDSITLPLLMRLGVTLGMGLLGEKSTTSIGINYVVGMGDTYNFNELFGDPVAKSDVMTHTITAVLAGSADL
jgi:hypothetical protein